MASDFLSWDDDLNLDILLEEYTDCELYNYDIDSDSDFDLPPAKKSSNVKSSSSVTSCSKPRSKPSSSNIYVCPLCNKHLKTISGFRGHTSKQHGKNHLKASDHRLQSADHKPAADVEIPESQIGSLFLSEETFTENFHNAFDASVVSIKEDELNNIDVFGASPVVAIAKRVRGNAEIEAHFLGVFKTLFSNQPVNLCRADDRDFLFNKLHRVRVNEDIKQKTFALFLRFGFESEQNVNSFVQVFYLEVLEELIRQQVNHHSKESQQQSTIVSENDQSILFYITGFIIRSLKKRYFKLGEDHPKFLCVQKLISHTDSVTFLHKVKQWTNRKDRGGLIIPCDNFFLLVREMEILVRKNVDISRLSASSLLSSKLTEKIMESFMVKYYVQQLFSHENPSIHMRILEDIVLTFLRIRGFAMCRLVKNSLSRANAIKVKKSKSLRETLKSVTNTH